MKNEYTLGEVVRMTGIRHWQMYYALASGRLDEPRRVGRIRIFTDADVEKVKHLFPSNAKGGSK